MPKQAFDAFLQQPRAFQKSVGSGNFDGTIYTTLNLQGNGLVTVKELSNAGLGLVKMEATINANVDSFVPQTLNTWVRARAGSGSFESLFRLDDQGHSFLKADTTWSFLDSDFSGKAQAGFSTTFTGFSAQARGQANLNNLIRTDGHLTYDGHCLSGTITGYMTSTDYAFAALSVKKGPGDHRLHFLGSMLFNPNGPGFFRISGGYDPNGAWRLSLNAGLGW